MRIPSEEDQRHLINWNQWDDENVSKKARVARNVLHIRGDDSVKFDVNEEAWPNADMVTRASFEGALIDGIAR